MFDTDNKLIVKVFLKSWIREDTEVFVELSTKSMKKIINLFNKEAAHVSNIEIAGAGFINFTIDIDYILSVDGQAVVEENGYITVSTNASYISNKPSGKVVVAGSSSVSATGVSPAGSASVSSSASSPFSGGTVIITRTLGAAYPSGSALEKIRSSCGT